MSHSVHVPVLTRPLLLPDITMAQHTSARNPITTGKTKGGLHENNDAVRRPTPLLFPLPFPSPAAAHPLSPLHKGGPPAQGTTQRPPCAGGREARLAANAVEGGHRGGVVP